MKPVSDLYDLKCPVCGGQKRVRFIVMTLFMLQEKRD